MHRLKLQPLYRLERKLYLHDFSSPYLFHQSEISTTPLDAERIRQLVGGEALLKMWKVKTL